MTIQQKLEFAKQVIAAIEKDLINPATGSFKKQPDYVDDALLVGDIEAAFLAQGGTLTDNVKKIVAGAIAVLQLL